MTSDDELTPLPREVEEAIQAATRSLDSPGTAWFDYSPQLAHVRTWAQSLDVNPWAGLQVVLVRLLGDVPPWVTLPPLGASPPASLNHFGVLAGGSGMGKSDVLTSHDVLLRPRPKPQDDPAPSFTPASGEGLLTRYVRTERGTDDDGRPRQLQHHFGAFADIDEIDNLGAQAIRTGSTLLANLRTMWSGKQISTATATMERERFLAHGSYRLVMIAGCQYGRGEVILGREAQLGGLLQRFTFADLRDPDLRRDSPRVPHPGRLEWEPPPRMPFPGVIGGNDSQRVQGRFTLQVHQVVHAEIWDKRRLSRMGDPGGVDGHAQLARLKVAAALAILHGTAEVGPEMWRLSEGVMQHSDYARGILIRELAASRERETSARGHGDALREAAADESRINRAITRYVTITRQHARDHQHGDSPGCTQRCFKNGAPRWRDLVAEALDEAVGTGRLLAGGTTSNAGKPVRHYAAPGPDQ